MCAVRCSYLNGRTLHFQLGQDRYRFPLICTPIGLDGFLQPQDVRALHQVGNGVATMDPQFIKDVLEMKSDRSFADTNGATYFLVGKPSFKQANDRTLSGRKELGLVPISLAKS